LNGTSEGCVKGFSRSEWIAGRKRHEKGSGLNGIKLSSK
jgi:hypothetical protein